jgi:GNAT superfamily N-acetyltransferase
LSVEVRPLTRTEVEARLNEMAALRINIFKDFPYIYDGSLEYEVKYLGRYLKAKNSHFVGAINQENQLVGLATCLPLTEEENFVQKPFLDAGLNLEEIFYFGESVLLSRYRGHGVGHKFFDLREQAAKKFGSKYTYFCAVKRPEQHPLKPEGYRPLDAFWKARGYSKIEHLKSYFDWKDLGQTEETTKEMVYWMRSLE